MVIVPTDSLDLAESCDQEKPKVFRVRDLGLFDDIELASKCRPRVLRAVSIVKYSLDNYLIYDTNCDILKRTMFSLSLHKELK
jgi:hypothetical protein